MARPEELESEDVAEHDIHWARREVVRNCIYGVDLNPMAVELAKLSLWLTTVASNKPLSFLDHHLRCGNSLIGAKLDGLMALPNSKRDPEQLPMWQFVIKQQKEHTEELLRQYADMAERADDDLQTVKWKEEKYKALRESELSRRLYELANVWLSTYFGNQVEEIDYEELQNHLSPNRFPDWQDFRGQEWFRRAQALASEKRFFHWELEFPEAFAAKENAGFDVVIGNPPYSSKLSTGTKQLMPLFELISYRCDPFAFFVEKGMSLVKINGNLGFIIPATWTGNAYYENLRKMLLESKSLKSIILFDGLVFEDANVDTSIVMASKEGVIERKFSMGISRPGLIQQMAQIDKDYRVVELSERFDIPRTVGHEWDDLIIKLHQLSHKLSEISSHISLGLRLASVTEYTSNAQNSNFSEPLFLGDNIERYGPLAPKLFFNSKNAPIVGGTKNPEIYNLNNKILMQSIRNLSLKRRLVPTLDQKGFYFGGNVVGIALKNITLSPAFVLALLASRLLNEFFAHRFVTISLTSTFLSEIPIRGISFTTPEPEQARLGAELKALYLAGKFNEILSSVEDCLPKDAQGNFIAAQEKSDVVHDLLAFLAEHMLEMNKQKQQEIKGFLGWLESEIGSKVEDLSPKTKVQEYNKLKFDELLAVLKKNKRKLAIDPARREPQERLRLEFDASLAKLQPLMERIRQTDELIDQIVYKLYGLTEEEIAIVEGK
jgi:hypothetical protein